MKSIIQPNILDRGLEPLLSIGELAEYLGVPVATIYDWRTAGKGPRGIRVGKHVKFSTSDVRAWVDSQRESSPGRLPGPSHRSPSGRG